MYTLDIINKSGNSERVTVTQDRLIRGEAPNKYEKSLLVERINNDPKYKVVKKGYNVISEQGPYIVTKERVYILSFDNVGPVVEPIYKRKVASSYTVYSDGTFDSQEVVSQDYNERYFDFVEYRDALKLS